MTGPFKPEDFLRRPYCEPGTELAPEYFSDLANSLDAKRWSCPKGGEHEPSPSWREETDDYLILHFGCSKCGRKLRPRWETV